MRECSSHPEEYVVSKGQKTLGEVQTELKLHLVPSHVLDITCHGSSTNPVEKDHVLELVFQPRKFHVQHLRAEAARLTKEGDRWMK